MSPRTRLESAAWLAAILLCAGCSRSPDIVAIDTRPVSDSSGVPFEAQSFTPCQPGDYQGTMVTIVRDGGLPIRFTGSISFALTLSYGREFSVLDDTAQLTGMGTGDDSHFTADIQGGRRCADGGFTTTLENGQYFGAGSTTAINFTGTISGDYVDDSRSFNGRWSAALELSTDNTITVGGTWSALRIGPN